ncbi:hypothetical protein [Pelosinus sp. sgz500959]|uniref:hypothetical protein n=1 Tax=Pelosinus sp. sgz500959 TaxID=3242472 RepID=UPI00366DF3EB
MDETKQLPGARESSAGDDFHLLWAGRKALSLLIPKSDLLALSIEGPHPEEAKFLDPEGDQLLAIDLAEYYGGERFTLAKTIVLSQLKYSTRTPEKEWTAARLSEGKVRGKRKTTTNNWTGSIVHRLAQTFERYYSDYGQGAVIQKLILKLVSNRPASELLSRSLAAVKECLNKQNPGTTRMLLNSISADEYVEIERLYNSSSLSSRMFLDFLRVLDVSECGEQSRFGQSVNLIKELGCFGPGDVKAQYTQLKDLIWDCMMPQAANKPPLTKYDILPIFGCNYKKIFPAQPCLELPQQILERNESAELARIIQTSTKKIICIHSGGGKGKTTLVQSIKDKLPSHSIVIVFDCYGGGTYLNPADTRHSHSRAISQIVNELAVQVGGPLLLHFNLTSEDYMRELLVRIQTTISLIRTSNPEALVVIAIDAADNSASAARDKNEKSFVDDIVRQPFPNGSRLVVTCRTENKIMLNLPDHELLELVGFDAAESSKHLRLYFPDATDFQAEEFYRLTQGIPRVQGYALELRSQGIDAVLSPLRPDGKSLGGLIESWLNEAKQRHGVSEEIDRICEALVALPRPVPLAYAAELAGVVPDTIKSLCVETRLGLIENDGSISFSDQDFEDHLRQRTTDTAGMIHRISDLLYKNRNVDSYAAYHIDTFLARTNRFKDLSDLVLQENIESATADPIERQELLLKRIRSAIELGKNEKERSVVIKLLWIAAETVKADKAVRTLIIENADLAETFGDAQTVQRLHLDIEKQEWPISSLFHSAAVLSRFESTREEADEKLKEAFGWLRWRSTCEEKERGLHRYPIKSEDIASGLEAMLRLRGADKIRSWLNGFTRQRFVYECVYRLSAKILRVDGVDVFERHFSAIPIRADICLAILKAYKETNNNPPLVLVERAAKVWHRFCLRGDKPHVSISLAGITLCEEVARVQSLRCFLPIIVDIFSPPILNYMPYLSGDEVDRVVGILRSRALKAKLTNQQITLDIFLPDELRDVKKDLSYKELEALKTKRSEFDHVFGFLLPAYELRADVVLGNISSAHFQSGMDECLGKIERDYMVEFRHNALPIYSLMVQALTDAAIMVREIPNSWVKKIIGIISQKRVGDIANFQLLLAGKVVALQTLHVEALSLLDEVRQDLEIAPRTSKEQIELLVQCTRVAEMIAPDVARYYFKLAVEAASEIDEEVFTQIICISSIANKVSNNSLYSNAELAYQFARFVEDCHRRMDGWDHFPWEEAIKGVFFLDPASVFAILSRWDDRGVRNIEDEIFKVLEVAVRRSFISPTVAYSLSILSENHKNRYEQLAMTILDAVLASEGKVRAIELLSLIAKDICFHAPISERKSRATAVVHWAKMHNVEHSKGVISLIELLSFLESMHKKPNVYDTACKTANDLEVPNWEEIFKSRSFLTADEIELAIDEVRKFDRYGREFQKELLCRMQHCCTVRDYTTQLDALLMVKAEKLSVDLLLEALNNRIEGWLIHPSVRDWREKKGADFVGRRFFEMMTSYHSRSNALKQFQSIFGVNDAELYNVVVGVLPQFVGSSAEITYEVIQELRISLSATETETFLQWLLERLSTKIPKACADGVWREELRPPQNSVEIVAKLIWRLLGHPDKRLRWRAAHAVRRMVHQGYHEIIDLLVALCDDKCCATMIDYEHGFFWLSARLWTFILLERLAGEHPTSIKNHAIKIMQEALEPDVPHALLRHFAQSTALKLNKHEPGIYSRSEITALSAINKSTLPLNKAKNRHYSCNRHTSSKKLRFSFNTMDTLPYWYNPLAGVFGEDRDTIAQLAEIWICDRWGMPADIDYKRDWIRQRYDYALYSHGQCSGPTIETVQTYAEWHSMFCVADELLKTRPVLYDKWENDLYGHWLGRWTLTWPAYWLADIRDSLPLEDIYWQLDEKVGENWDKEISPDAFDPLIGLTESPVPKFLVLHGSYRRAIHGASESMHISSALVNPDTASALLRALQTAVNPNDYRVPSDEKDELEIFSEGFELKGWLRVMEANSEGIDKDDPLSNHISSSLVIPGVDFVEWANLEYSPDRKQYWRKEKSGYMVTLLECWNEQPLTDREYREFYSVGHRLRVDVNTLLDYLNERQRCLIVKCTIDRWVDKEGKGKYVPGKAKIYLIHADGTLETLRERYCIREKTR